jgi:hypothetical protein
MARLINDIADLKRHIIVAATFDFKGFAFCQTSRTQNTRPSRSGEYDALVIHNFDGNSNEPLDLVKELFESAIANYALLKSLPTINVLITNSGTKHPKIKKLQTLIGKRKEICQDRYSTYNEDLDNAFQIMEENIDLFTD